MKLWRCVIAACLAALIPSAAGASDTITMAVAGQQMPIHGDSAGFDWSGFYAGLSGVGQASPASGTQYGVGLSAGVNAQIDFVLVGAEVSLQGLGGGAVETAYGQVTGRAGLLITDDLLLYAAAGYGVDLGLPAAQDVMLGGGVELALTGDWSVRAQYLRAVPLAAGDPRDQVSLGAHFHF